VGQHVATAIGEMAEAIRLTQDLFPGHLRVEVEQDPELPDESYIVFNVKAEGDLADIISRRLQWHDQIHQRMREDPQRLKLSVDAQT